MDARHHDLVYDLTDVGLDALTEAGRLEANPQTPRGPWIHKHTVACITASIELATLARAHIRFLLPDVHVMRQSRPTLPYTHNRTTETRTPTTTTIPVTAK